MVARVLLLLPLVLILGCPEIFTDDPIVDAGPRGIGEECDSDADCASGLSCVQRTCTPDDDEADAGPDAG
jgi:hypothetical protein